MNLPGTTLLGKYKIGDLLREGGTSFVYKARDLENSRDVAVKLMKPDVTSSYFDDLLRFKLEITAISQLKHSGVIKLFETGEYENRPFLVMELLSGESLADLIKRHKSLQTEVVVEIVEQLAEILEYVHGKGIIHRDLKPGNIVISCSQGKRQVKVLDFGLSLLVELKAIQGEQEIAGTFGYMSPEATGILKRRIDERSDLYSLGVVFYQLLTGVPPFTATEIGLLVHQQAALNPRKIRMINPVVPKVLEEIVMKLLMKDPDLRYQSARGLLSDLKRFSQGESDFIIGEQDPAVKLSFHSSLVGREREFNKLVELFNQARLGQGSLCLIAGEPGIGKSRLIEDFGAYVTEQNGLFVHGKCFNHQSKMPHQPFMDITDDYLRRIASQKDETIVAEKIRLKKLIRDRNGVLYKLNPRLKEYGGESDRYLTYDPEQDTQRFLMAAAEFFCKLGEFVGTAVIFVDDLQWADEASLILLAEILGNIKRSKVLLIGAYREHELINEHFWQKIRQKALEQAYPLLEMQLDSLAKESLTRLVSQILHQNAMNIPGLENYIYEKSQGNPFFAVNILRNLVDNKVLYWHDGNWRVDNNKLNLVPIADNLIDIIIQRINNLSPEQTQLLCKGAVIGKEFSVALLNEISGLDSLKFISRIEEAISSQLLERSPARNRLIFVHDRIREAFLMIIPDLEKAQIHLEIAAILEPMERQTPGSFIFELAHHYLAGGNLEKALPYVVQAADKAKEAYANEEALQYYLIARELLEQKGLKNTSVWLRVCHKLAEVYQALGNVDKTISLVESILPYLEGAEKQARIHRLLALAFNKKGEWNRSMNHSLLALRIMGEKIPAHKAAVYYGLLKEIATHLGHNLFWENIYLRKRVASFRNEKELAKPLVVSRLLYNLNWVSALTGQHSIANLWMILRMLNQAETEVGASFELGLATVFYGSVWASLARFNGAYRQFERAISIFKASGGNPFGEASAYHFLGLAYLWAGQYSEAMKNIKFSLNEFQKLGDHYYQGLSLSFQGVIEYYQAEYRKSLITFQHYLELCQSFDIIIGIALSKIHMAACLLEQGDYGAARPLLDQAFALSVESNMKYVICIASTYLGYLELEQENYTEAVSHLQNAAGLDRSNNFMKNFTGMVYPLLVEGCLKKALKERPQKTDAEWRKELHAIRLLCKEALCRTRKWVNNYPVSLRIAAMYYALMGKRKEASNKFNESINILQRLGRKYELAKSHYEFSLLLQESGQEQEAFKHLQCSQALFQMVGAKAYIVKINLPGVEGSDIPPPNPVETVNSRERLNNQRRMETLSVTGCMLSSILDLHTLLEKILDSSMELLGAERGSLLIYPEAGGSDLELKATRNINQLDLNRQISRSVIENVISKKQALILADAVNDSSFKNQASIIAQEIRSVICVPIINRDMLIGLIYLDNHLLKEVFTEEDRKVLELIASQAGVCIENARLYRRLKKYSQELEQSRDAIADWNRTLEQRVDERTRELNNLIEQLKEHARTVEELTIAKERNRLAMDVHDTLGNTMTLLIKLLEASKINIRNNPEKTEAQIDDAIMAARDGFTKLKRSIKGLAQEKLEANTFETVLYDLVKEYQAAGVKIDLETVKIPQFRDKNFSFTIFKICQEAVTNAIRHGKAKNVAIRLQTNDNILILTIKDNGDGCNGFVKGSGLTGMEQRVNVLNGKITFNTIAREGFTIRAEIPIKGG